MAAVTYKVISVLLHIKVGVKTNYSTKVSVCVQGLVNVKEHNTMIATALTWLQTVFFFF